MVCVKFFSILPPPNGTYFFPIFFLFPLIILFLLSHHFPRCLCLDDYHYSNCTSPSGSECGYELGKIEYPFWVSGLQPDYCGHPLFKLDCEEGKNAVIEIRSQRYKVLHIDYDSQILKIVTIENAFPTEPLVCPKWTLVMDSTLFFQYNSNVRRVAFTLAYNCSADVDDHSESYSFPCKVDDQEHEAYLTTNTSPAYEIESRCEPNSEVITEFPVLDGELEGLANGSLDSDRGKVLRAGFEVRWAADTELCQKCIRSGGTCGFDINSNKTSCFCRDKPHQTTCSTSMYPVPFRSFHNQVSVLCVRCFSFVR